MNNSILCLLPFFVALVVAQNSSLSALVFNQQAIILNPGQNYTTSFNPSSISPLYGSQYAIWIPQNASRIRITWQRSPTSDGCPSFSTAYLLGKYGSFPCASSSYNLPNDLCSSHYNTMANSNGVAQSTVLSAYSTNGLEFTWSSPASNDFVRGEYLYMASYLDLTSGSDCTATLNVDFDYCTTSSIPAEDFANKNSKCVGYTEITGRDYSATTTIDSYPAEGFWLLNIPANSSGVRVTVSSYDTSVYYYIYGRLSVGGENSRYMGYASGYNTKKMFIPNPPAGELVVSVVLEGTNFLQFDISITVQSCPEGMTSDNQGNCLYPLTVITPAQLADSPVSVTVPAYDSSVNGDCNWRVYGFLMDTWNQEFFNITVLETGGANLNGKVYIRKNAWPTYNFFDYSTTSNATYNLTPEEFYLGKPTWFFIGFCNDDSTEESTWILTGGYINSAVVSPTPSPSAVPSPSSAPSQSPVPSNSPMPSSSPIPSVTPTTSVLPSESPAPSTSPAVTPSPAVPSPSAVPSVSALPSTDPVPSTSPVVPSQSPAASPSPDVDSSAGKITVPLLLITLLVFVL